MVVVKHRFLLLGGMLKIFISYGHDTESCSSILLYGLLFTLSTCDHVQEIFKIHGVRLPKASLVFHCFVEQHIGCSTTTGLCLDGARSSAVHQTSTDLCFEPENI